MAGLVPAIHASTLGRTNKDVDARLKAGHDSSEMPHLIAIDQGTTSTRAIVFDAALAPGASDQSPAVAARFQSA